MKKSIAKQWVKALRSGEYDQIKNRLGLSSHDGRLIACCGLGVLCDISGQGEWVHGSSGSRYKTGCAEYGTGVPWLVRKWAGIKGQSLDRLMRFNDKEGYSFDKLADYIERAWWRL